MVPLARPNVRRRARRAAAVVAHDAKAAANWRQKKCANPLRKLRCDVRRFPCFDHVVHAKATQRLLTRPNAHSRVAAVAKSTIAVRQHSHAHT